MDLLQNIYESITQPKQWRSTLDQIAPLAGAKSTAIVIVNHRDGAPFLFNATSTNVPDSVSMEYQQTYAKYETEVIKVANSSELFSPVTDPEQQRNPETFSKRPDVLFLQEKLGVFDRVGFRLNLEKEWFNSINFQFDTSRGQIEQYEIDRITPYFHHIARAVSMGRVFALLQARYKAALSILDRVNMGYMVALETGEIILSNSFAESALRKRDGLALNNQKKLTSNDSSTNSKMYAAIARAAATALARDNYPGESILIRKRGSEDKYLIDISPLRDYDNELYDFAQGVLITLIDPSQHQRISTKGLSILYSLSAAESAVADMIIAGLTNQEIAEARNVSIETIKKQSKAIFAKSLCRNRVGLIRRVLSINIPITE